MLELFEQIKDRENKELARLQGLVAKFEQAAKQMQQAKQAAQTQQAAQHCELCGCKLERPYIAYNGALYCCACFDGRVKQGLKRSIKGV